MRIIGHNLVSDLSYFARNGFPIPSAQFFDTEVGFQWLFPDESDFGLEALVLGTTDMPTWRDTLGKLDFDDFEAMSDERLARRCGGDAEAAYRLLPIAEAGLKQARLTKIWNLAMSVLPILAEIGGRGMAVDMKALNRRASGDAGLGVWLAKEKTALQDVLGIENVNSDIQVAGSLFGPKFRAVPLEQTLRGWSVKKRCLFWARYHARMRKQRPLESLLTRLLTYNERDKLYSTYYRPWLESNGRVHSLYSLGKAATGRLASSKTNLMNVPDIARELIVPSPGYDMICQADFKSFELAGAAHVSRDPVMIDWITRGVDMHSIMASKVMGLPEPKTEAEFVDFKKKYKQQRDTGKMTMFASLYLVSAESLSWQIFEMSDGTLYLPEDEVQKYIDTLFTTFPTYDRYVDTLWADLHAGKWIQSDFGRRWQFEPNGAGLRRATNYPVQSACSDLTILALYLIYHELKRRKMKSRLISEVHDSVGFETTHQELKALCQLVKEICEEVLPRKAQEMFGFTLRVPLRIDLQAGPTWGSLEEVHA